MITAEELQEKIDHYFSVAKAENELGNHFMFWFYNGKRDAYINVLSTMYLEIKDLVFPFYEERHKHTIAFIKGLKSSKL